MIHVQSLAKIYSKIIYSKECIPEIRPCEYSVYDQFCENIQQVSKRIKCDLIINSQKMHLMNHKSYQRSTHYNDIK